VRPRRSATALVLALVALALILADCSGDDDEEATTNPAPAEAPERATPPNSPGTLPAEFIKCMAEQGFDVNSLADIHSAPQRVLQACFGALHQNGG
jgi:hypothetical protein